MKVKLFLIIVSTVFLCQNCKIDSEKSSDSEKVKDSETEIEKPATSEIDYESRIKQFIPIGYEIMYKKIADINIDSIPDIIVILKNIDESALTYDASGELDGLTDSKLSELEKNLGIINDSIITSTIDQICDSPRPAMVFFGKTDGSFIPKGRNDKIVNPLYDDRITLGGRCFGKVAVKDNYFTFEQTIGPKYSYIRTYHTFKVRNNEIYFHRYDNDLIEITEEAEPSSIVETIRADKDKPILFSTY